MSCAARANHGYPFWPSVTKWQSIVPRNGWRRVTTMPGWLAALGESADAVYVVDSRRRVLLWNKAAEQLFGYGEQEVLGRRCCDTIAGKTCDGTAWCHNNCQVQRAASRGALHRSFNLVVRAKEGHEVCVNISIIAIHHQTSRFTVHIARRVECHSRDEETLLKIREVLRLGGAVERAAIGSGGHRSEDPASPAALPSLSGREIEILSLVAEGLPNESIATKLCVSSFTVRNHVQHILDKLGLHSKSQAVTFAFRNHLLQ